MFSKPVFSGIDPPTKKSVFLEVDPTLVENNLRLLNQDEENEEFNKLFNSPEINYPTKVVKPSPGFCIKTKEVLTAIKVFINICTTDAIPAPRDISVEELMTIIESDDIGDYKVPMSIGEIRTDKDKKGEEARVCDIAIHPTFYRKVKEIREFRNFFSAIVFQGLENKYGLVCHDEKIILKNRKAFGTLQMHRIQQREIEEKMKEASSSSSDSSRTLVPLMEDITDDKSVMDKVMMYGADKEPEYILYKTKSGSNCLYGEFKLPHIATADDLNLDIGEDRIMLADKLKGYMLDIFLPCMIKQSGCTSEFNKRTRTLNVTMPILGG